MFFLPIAAIAAIVLPLFWLTQPHQSGLHLFMFRFARIISTSFKMALSELWKNKLRTFLSLFGITIGIFCIISVLATVGSLERNLQTEIKSLGNNTIYVDKWEYGGGPDYPFWKYAKRPTPAHAELAEVLKRTPMARYAAFKIGGHGAVEGAGNMADRVRLFGVTEGFSLIQGLEIAYGRYLSDNEFYTGAPVVVIGYTLAENLYGNPAAVPAHTITVKGRQCRVAGVLKKQGSTLIGGWGFDDCVLTTYQFGRTFMDERRADPLLLVQGKEGITSKQLNEDLQGSMRAVRKLKIGEDPNFSLNDVNDFSETMSGVFVSINLAGWIIGGLSFIVGIFGVANIMFVTVKERTMQIGLKKALGAKRSTILTEFLLESAFLCIIGGLIGLLLVYVLTKIATAILDFPIFLSPSIIGTAIGICIAAGIAAGIIPAARAARLNPVVAIRS